MMDELNNSENLLVDLVREIVETTKKSVEVGVPCVVTKVISRTKVDVRPLIKLMDKDGNAYRRDEIEGIPVFTGGGKDTFISFPLKVGDIGWLNACDRDISLFLQSYEESEPPTKRIHSFSDAVFVPDIMTNITVDSEDDDAVVIQNRTGTVKIALDQNEIRIKNGPVSLVLDDSSVTGVAPGGFDLNGFLIDSSGAATSPVSLSAPSIVAGGKELAGHDHPAGTPPGNTGPNN